MPKITPEREAEATRELVAGLDRRRAVAEWADYIAPRVAVDDWPAGERYPDLSELFEQAGRHFADAGAPWPTSAEPGDQDAFLDDVADAVVRRYRTAEHDAGEHVSFGADIVEQAREALALVGESRDDAMRALVRLALRVTGDES